MKKNKLIELLIKYKSFLMYGVFGVLTTVINILTYNVCYYHFELSNTFSNIIAWILAVIFAYITNKVWVFESPSWRMEVLKREVVAFVSCRLVTGILDIIIMYICVDIMALNGMIMKVISNVLVIILNYIFSKLVIFKKK